MISIKRGLIVVRQSPSWSTIQSIDDLKPEEFDKIACYKTGTTRFSIELWNKIFKKSFFEVRHLLKLLSIQSFGGAHNTDVDLSGRRQRISRWRIMMLTDDDDWVKSDWLKHLPNPNPSIRFCRWRSVKFNGEIHERNDSNIFSYTNNYSAYPLSRKFYKLQDIYQHGSQNSCHNLLAPPLVEYVDSPITITHKHPASANMIQESLQLDENPEKALYSSVEKYLSRIDRLSIPEELNWIEPFVEKSRQVFSCIL